MNNFQFEKQIFVNILLFSNNEILLIFSLIFIRVIVKNKCANKQIMYIRKWCDHVMLLSELLLALNNYII